MNTSKRQQYQRRITGTAAGLVAAFSLAVGSLFETPQELLALENQNQEDSCPEAIVSVGKRVESSAGKRLGLRQRMQAFLLRAPAAVRALVLLPLWLMGRVSLAGLSVLWSALAPFSRQILAFALQALLLTAVLLILYKLLFPKASLRTFFRPRNLLFLSLGALVLTAADALLRLKLPDYAPISLLIKIALGFVVLFLLCLRFGHKQRA